MNSFPYACACCSHSRLYLTPSFLSMIEDRYIHIGYGFSYGSRDCGRDGSDKDFCICLKLNLSYMNFYYRDVTSLIGFSYLVLIHKIR